MSLDIKKEREKRGMTQEQFAELLGVNKKTIVNYESGGNIPETKLKMFTRVLYENCPNTSLIEDSYSIFYDIKGRKISDKEVCEYVVRNLDRLKESDVGLRKSIDIEALKILVKAKKPDGTIDVDKVGN
ncbi:helix-turn-helix domain-containing protein [Aquimarina longa]|uniref:helix-turn-helix domain-containing protein n=1 Tax=Aquimarina longa TaxID=1080221 RepID=UPI000785D9CA|nr:helix-turn-helix transcriptional regulator [Aquimarina longa]